MDLIVLNSGIDLPLPVIKIKAIDLPDFKEDERLIPFCKSFSMGFKIVNKKICYLLV
jgi:hypothetical protein